MSKNILGALCMVVSVTFFSLMDILVKVTDDYAVGQILFFRALFGFIPLFVLFHISSGSCSTQPLLGKYCLNSN